jgi:ketosteroid isomerase-like protein
VDRPTVQAWLDRYILAWESNDAGAIGDLFTEDAAYSYGPFRDDVKGRAAIVSSWFEDPDEPGSWSAEYHPVAVEGDTAIANGRSRYLEPDGSLRTEYDNIFLIRFAEDGRCTEFREWFVERPR